LISPLRVPSHCAFLVLLVMMGLGHSLVLISPLRVPSHCAFFVLLVMMGLGPSLV